MDISILKQVFPEDQFIIKHDDRSKLNQTATIITKGGSDMGCATMMMDKDGTGVLHIGKLDRCGIKGSETLKKIEEFARMSGFKKITLKDESFIYICTKLFGLAQLKILTKGESWYNSLGYKSTNYDNEKKNNESLIKKTLKEFFSNTDLAVDEKEIKSIIIRLLCHRTFTRREPEGLDRDDLTEEELENHSLQSISNMLLNLASDCENKKARSVLSRLIESITWKAKGDLMIQYDRNLEKTLNEPLPEPLVDEPSPRSERGAYKTSSILSKGSKKGGSKRANRRKKSLKRKRL
jgi:hypothetical protein